MKYLLCSLYWISCYPRIFFFAQFLVDQSHEYLSDLDFEAMKSEKLVIRPWLSCPYYKHTLMDLQSSMVIKAQKNKTSPETL